MCVGYARIVVKGATTALTRRTSHRKLLATPSSPMVTQGYLFALGMAQVKTGMLVHHGTLMPNHTHVAVTPTDANLPEFVRRLNRESSCFLKAYLRERGYEAPATIWDDRDPHCMRLVDAASMISWLVYQHTNCVAAGLVRRVEDYPGWVSTFGAMKRGVVVVKKPPLYFGRRCPKEVELELSPPPLLTQVYGGNVDKLVYDLETMARRRAQQLGRQIDHVLGAEGVRRQHPWAEPRTTRELPGDRVPQFKVGGDDARVLRMRCVAEQRGFRRRYADDRRRFTEGETMVSFPYGTYGMRAIHGANMEEAPPADAVLCAPGPLPGEAPDEAWTALQRQRVTRDAESLVGVDGQMAHVGSATADHGRTTVEHPPADGTHPPVLPGDTRERAMRVVTLRELAPEDPDPAPS